jgi:hypothetical protein
LKDVTPGRSIFSNIMVLSPSSDVPQALVQNRGRDNGRIGVRPAVGRSLNATAVFFAAIPVA